MTHTKYFLMTTTEKCSLGIMKYIYSYLKSYLMVKHNISIKTIMLLCEVVKKIVQDNAAFKKGIFCTLKLTIAFKYYSIIIKIRIYYRKLILVSCTTEY